MISKIRFCVAQTQNRPLFLVLSIQLLRVKGSCDIAVYVSYSGNVSVIVIAKAYGSLGVRYDAYSSADVIRKTDSLSSCILHLLSEVKLVILVCDRIFSCLYNHNHQLTKRVLFVSQKTPHLFPSAEKKYNHLSIYFSIRFANCSSSKYRNPLL